MDKFANMNASGDNIKVTEIFEFIEKRDTEKLSLLINYENWDINGEATDTNLGDITVLMKCAYSLGADDQNRSHILKLLLNHPNIDINHQTTNTQYVKGFTALHFATTAENIQNVLILLEDNRCDINIQDERGYTAFLLAVCTGHLAITQAYLKCTKCDVNMVDNENMTALHLAIAAGHSHVLKLLLEDGRFDLNIRNMEGNTPIQVSVLANELESFQILLADSRCDITLTDEDEDNLMHLASGAQNSEFLKLIINDKRLNLTQQNNRGWSILHIAAENGCESNVLKILEVCHDIIDLGDEFENTAFHVAAENGHLDVLKIFLKHPQCNLNMQNILGRTPLHIATDVGHPECVQLLFANNRIDVRIKDENAETPFDTAVQRISESTNHKHKAVLKAFYDLVFSPSTHTKLCDKSQYYVLCHFIRQYGKISNECTDILLSREESVNYFPYTLALAIEYSPSSICRLLLGKRCCVNSAFPETESALHCAVRINSYKKCELLVRHGADATKLWRGMTPFQYAISLGCSPEILNLLGRNQNRRSINQNLRNFCFVGETPFECVLRLEKPKWANYLFESCDNVKNVLPVSSKVLVKTENLSLLTDIYIDASKRLLELKVQASNPKIFSTKLPTKYKMRNISVLRDLIAASHNCNFCSEAKYIRKCVFQFLRMISTSMSKHSETAHFEFKPIPAGSMAEGTKTFRANELDVICEFIHTDTLNISDKSITVTYPSVWGALTCDSESLRGYVCPRKLAKQFYMAFEREMKKFITMGCYAPVLGNLYLHYQSLEMRDKISCIKLLWRGFRYSNMIIHVDLVPAFYLDGFVPLIPLSKLLEPAPYHAFAKVSRHDDSESYGVFEISHACGEVREIRDLPRNVKRGLIIAKAMRIPSISEPDDLLILGLSESIRTDDYITSYMLKTTLFLLLRESGDTTGSECDWAERIYCELERRMQEDSKLPAHFDPNASGGHVFECSHINEESAELACCLTRQVVLGLCRAIRLWLGRNKAHLEYQLHGKHLVYSRHHSPLSFR